MNIIKLTFISKAKVAFVLLALFFSQYSYAQKQVVSPKVTEAVLYLNQARVVSEASVSLNKGHNELVLAGLSQYVDDHTVQVTVGERTQIISITTSYNYLQDERTVPAIRKLLDKKEGLEAQVSEETARQKSFELQMELIKKNATMGSEQSRTPESIASMAAIAQKETFKITNSINAVKLKLKDLNKELRQINQQLNEERTSVNELSKQIVLELSASSAHQANVELSYMIGNAYWTPSYDIRASSDDDNIEIVYKADVVQNSGLNWEQVKLTFSSYRPRDNQNRPILHPQYVSTNQPNAPMYAGDKAFLSNALQSKVSGMVIMSDSVELEEELSLTRQDATSMPPPPPLTQVENSNVGVEYVLNERKSLSSTHRAQSMVLQSTKTPARHIFHVVPKISTNVYHLANIQDWQKLNLLAGTANIYYSNRFMGTTNINPKYTKEELPVSLGIDERIVVQRKQINDFKSQNLLKKTENLYNYEIKVQNGSSQAINIEVLDQIPLSKQNEVIVTPIELSKIKADDNGTLLWNLELAPRETETIILKYKVQYPRGEQVFFEH